jgi:calcineurin-like phosphoesterase family protein
MVVFSKDPDVAEQQMTAIIFYLTTFGYIDGSFDLSEKIFVLEYIRHLVEMRVEEARIEDPMVRLELTNKYTAHFDEIFEQIDNQIRGHFDEVVASEENVEQFVYAKLKLHAFEIFKWFDEANQRTLLDAIDKLIRADGVVSPAEQRFRDELVALLGQSTPMDLAREHVHAPARAPTDREHLGARVGGPPPPAAPSGLRLRDPVAVAPQMDNHPLLEHMEHHYSRDPRILMQQAQGDWELISQTMELWNEQRRGHEGRLAGKQSVAELAGQTFLDQHIYVLMPEPAREVELIVLGDMHGCYSCLKGALMQSDFFRKVADYRQDPARHPFVKLVLLGDYIDRGQFSYNGILRTVMQLFVSMPEHVYILRGNHEYYVEHKGRIHGGVRPAEAILTLEPYLPKQMFESYMVMFEAMPNMLLFDRTLFVHAGIPRDETLEAKWQDLSSLNDPDIRFQMLWSDPSQASYIPMELQRENARFPFGRQQFRAFMERIGATTMVRGHEKIDEGFKKVYDDDGYLLLNLFSAGGATNNDLPETSSYRKVTPMAMTVTWRGGVQTATPWAIDWASYNYPERNAFFRLPPEIEFKAG